MSIPDRHDEDWRRYSQASQKAPDFPLPQLELGRDPREGLPHQLLILLGDPSLMPNAKKQDGKSESKPESKPESEQKRVTDQFPANPNFLPSQVPDLNQGKNDIPKYNDIPQYNVPPLQLNEQFYPSGANPGFDLPRQDQVSPVFFDQSGYATDIAYPNNKMRHIERDPQTHEAKVITTTTGEGTTRLVNQNGRWFMEVQGMQLPFPGKIEAGKNGDIAMQTSADGIWRVEKPDGTITEEKENADGARISYDVNHRLSKITRQDGTTYEQPNSTTIIETHPGARPIVWSKQGGEASIWTADSGAQARRNLTLSENGSVAFEDANGIKHTINGRGLETLEGAGLGKITPDASGRTAEVETADGKKVRKYEYFDDKGQDIKSITIVDKEKNSTTVYTRESADSKNWRSDRGSWYGEIKVSADGVHSIRSSSRYRSNDDDSKGGKWTSYHPDGRETTDQLNADGSRASYDKENNLVSYRSNDGVRIDRVNDQITHYDPKIGQTIKWTKDADGSWKSDSERFKDSRKDLAFNTAGELSYTNDRGGKVQEHRDGSKQILEKDGTKLDFDRDGQIVKATKGNLERTFVRDGEGIKSVIDRNLSTKEERAIFDRRPPGEENRTNIFVSPNGDLSYQNPDGSAVIERSNMLHLELDKDGDLTRVVGPKSTREFRYIGEGDNKTLVSLTDTRKSEKGDKVENWSRVANPDGSFSNEFRSKDEKGNDRKSRYNITPCADGEYEYRLASDKAGDKVHVERLTKEGLDGMPEGIEDARQELIGQLENVMDKARLEKNIGFMKKFEQRMMDQMELQLAAGIDRDAVMRETERCIVDTYYHTARLCAPRGQKEMYGLKDRVRLAENLLYLAQDPSDIKQGSTGTCWWESSWNVGLFQRNAGHGARIIADVALTSQYTSTAGPLKGGGPKTIKVPPEHVQMRGSNGGGSWTPENAKSSSARSPVGMIIDQLGPPLGGQRGWGRSNAGWHTEARNILYMFTGRDQVRHGSSSLGRHEKIQLLKTGGWTASGGGHMWGYSMHKEKDGSWVVIRDDQYNRADRVIQRITNLKQWLSGDVASEARNQWRPSKPRKGDSTDSSPSFSSWTNRTSSRWESDDYGDRVKVVDMNRPVWRPSSSSR